MSRIHVAKTPGVAVLMSRVRVEEKLIMAALEARGVTCELIDDRQIIFDLHENGFHRFAVVLERCINHSRALYALRILNDWPVLQGSRTQIGSAGILQGDVIKP